jgi:hypothetical protein
MARRARRPADEARRGRGRDHSHAQLHRHRLDELARRRAALGARLRQFGHAANRRGRRAAASPAAHDAQSRFPYQPRFSHRLRRMEPVLGRRLRVETRRPQSTLQPGGRHRIAAGRPSRDDRIGRRRRTRRRHPYAWPVHRFVAGFSPGYGFTGIAIALLARNSAVGVAVAAILFGALSSAGANIQLFSNVPIEIVEILQGAVMIFAVAQFGFGRARLRAAT